MHGGQGEDAARAYLRNLQQAHLAVVVDDGAALDVRARLQPAPRVKPPCEARPACAERPRTLSVTSMANSHFGFSCTR